MNTENSQKTKSKGEILKEAREAKGVTLETVHDVTKIPLDILRAMEEGYTVRTLSSFYFKAFMKKYAEYLGVEVSDVVEGYNPEKLPEPIKEDSEGNLQKQLEKFFTRERQQKIVKGVCALVALFVVFKVAGCMSKSFRNRPQKVKTVKIEKRIEKKDKEKTLAEKKTVKPIVPPQPKPRPPVTTVSSVNTQKVNLTVYASKKVWMQVKVDGNLVFQSTLKEGDGEAWQANEKIEISGKNLFALDFELNNKILQGVGRDARRVIVTRDGLTAKKL